MQVFLNGAYPAAAEAFVSLDDRGFLFSDGIYEVLLAYRGRILLGGEHANRMRAGLAALQIDTAPATELLEIAERLIDLNQLRDRDALIYAQVTRGSAPRQHAFPPAGTPPTFYVNVKPFTAKPPELFAQGGTAITVPDTRWSRCDIKTITLLPNVLANQAAHAAGALEALFIRDGVVIEGSHSNVMAVLAGELVTYPSCNYILSGITRDFVLGLARNLGVSVREGPIFAASLFEAEELFLTGTTVEVMPITHVDGRPIANGRPGPVTRRLAAEYRARL
jgi:D-alanine transaminase